MPRRRPAGPDGELIARNIRRALRGREQKWLSKASGVPTSTLSTQLRSGSFSLETLMRIAPPLETTVGALIGERAAEAVPLGRLSRDAAAQALEEIDEVIRRARVTASARHR